MKWFILAVILVTSPVAFGSEPSGKDARQLEPSWECARSCWVPFSYLMAQKYRLVGQELIVVGWARRIGSRLYLFPDQDRAVEGVYRESIHLVPEAAIIREMAGVDLEFIEVKGYVIYDSRPVSDAWMRFRVTRWERPPVRAGQSSMDPAEYEGVEQSHR